MPMVGVPVVRIVTQRRACAHLPSWHRRSPLRPTRRAPDSADGWSPLVASLDDEHLHHTIRIATITSSRRTRRVIHSRASSDLTASTLSAVVRPTGIGLRDRCWVR